MYCTNCGQQISDDSVFCEKCGTKVPHATPVQPTAAKSASGIVCPNCGSKNLVPVVKQKVSGGNSASDACCGLAFLGPLGLLCGMHRTNVENQTFWVCQDCGAQNRDHKELKIEILSTGIALLIAGIFVLWIEISGDVWWPLWIIGIGLVTFGSLMLVQAKQMKP